MNTKSLKTLEYDKIIKMLVEQADSEPGKEICKNLLPSVLMAEIQKNQQETADAVSRLFKKGSTSFGGNKDLRYAVKSLEVGSTLSAPELLHLAGQLVNAERIKSYGVSENEDAPRDSLDDYFDNLHPLTSISSEINRCILAEDEFADDASPALKNIRRRIVSTSDKIHSVLRQMVNGSLKSYLQDSVITMRDDRYCIPVKAEYKSQVPGMIHDQSSTGSTFFIEPSAVVSLNNDIRELMLEEKKEIEKILADLSYRCAEHTDEIAENQRILTNLDFIFAKGKLALLMNASCPMYNRKHYLNLKKARHPLLDKNKVVPIDIYLGRDFDQLIVTGPNTGGKTVSLKTVGLLCLMGQAGLHVPCSDRSELCIFNDVFADIGDEQSIEQSLSTFSSHMVNIVEILKKADKHSLCLFDELGAGTDPTEGAALAISILSYLHENEIRTMATTHYSELKLYALSTEGIMNASCEFNVESLRPTYRLLIGIPGKSNAFAISSKLGLPEFIIDKAKEQISSENESFEDVISDLEQNRITIENERKEIAEYKEKIRTLQEQLHAKNEKLDAAKNRILREANEQARDILQEAKDFADETIRDINKAAQSGDVKALESGRTKVRKSIDDKNTKLSQKSAREEKADKKGLVDPSKLKKGDSVRIISMNLKGTVATLPDSKGNLFVLCGIIRTQTNVNDLAYSKEVEVSAPGINMSSGAGKLKMSKAMNISSEINLLGKTGDEAISELEKYLDDAYIAHLSSVRIVHGKGTGALRTAVHNYLRRQKHVADYRLGEYGEGDAGVTIVTFK
ncbi:MAG: endonuclease MutS2 [Lachnospiraceae bacterium]|nr:endonuclease MutS2 [Lachnospiraceae bacterium]